jgi:hypothetical protein
MKSQFSRREFLKYSAFAAAGAFLPFKSGFSGPEWNFSIHRAYPLGRVLYDQTVSYKTPDPDSDPASTFLRNDVIPISAPVAVKPNPALRDVWHQLEDESFIRARDIQPVDRQLNTPLSEVSSYGQLAEITVPFTTALYRRRTVRKPNQVFYYGSLHWIYELGKDSSDNLYYRVREDRWGDDYYIDARHMRVFESDELSPISADMDPGDKKIHISIKDQLVVAYEKDQPVFTSSMASGLLSDTKDYSTLPGSYKIDYKRPSRHMLHSDRVGIDSSELFGVPWVTYFTNTGIAFHGTYWHNDFSRPRSHGCVNLPIPAARWIYQWTSPAVPPREKTYVSRYGTPVSVF